MPSALAALLTLSLPGSGQKRPGSGLEAAWKCRRRNVLRSDPRLAAVASSRVTGKTRQNGTWALRLCNWKLVGTVLDCGGAQHLISCRKNIGRPATRQRKHARKRALIRT